MRSLFLDTEFTCLSLDRRLISLALVGAQGDECYIELNEGWTVEGCSEFVQQVVLPQLDLARNGHSLEQARRELAEHESARGAEGGAAGLDRLQPYRDRVSQHERNIVAIQKELSNLR